MSTVLKKNMAGKGASPEKRFKGKGIGMKSKQPPISVGFPADVDAILRLLPNRSEYIRKWVIEGMVKDGYLSSE